MNSSVLHTRFTSRTIQLSHAHFFPQISSFFLDTLFSYAIETKQTLPLVNRFPLIKIQIDLCTVIPL